MGKFRTRVAAWLRNFIATAVYQEHKRGESPFRRADDPFLKMQEEVRYEAGLIKHELHQSRTFDNPRDAGYRVYSQFEEDGIIQELLRHVAVENDLFVEIGVEDYRESNTRYLLQKDDWKGVLIDGSDYAREFVYQSELFWKHQVDVIQQFLTAENINSVLAPYAGDIGLLSIDVDGNDYHLWRAISVISPRIVVVEYQSNFGPDLPISTPYRADFDRFKHHASGLCAGASLSAFDHLAREKGYTLVASTKQHNAFFVRNDVLGSLRPRSVAECYVAVRFREMILKDGVPTHIGPMVDRRREMRDAKVVNVVTGAESTIGQLFLATER